MLKGVTMKYRVEIKETLKKTVSVEAANKDEAIDKVADSYYKTDIILDDSDYADVEFKCIEEVINNVLI